MEAREFPPPATVRLEDHAGIIGSIKSPRFARMENRLRQNKKLKKSAGLTC
jgi:hypothetical protein